MFSYDEKLGPFLAALQPPIKAATTKRKPTKPTAAGIHYGTVAHWNGSFGYIRSDRQLDHQVDRGEDLFFGARALEKSGITSIAQRDRICFDVAESKKRRGRFEAVNITIINSA